MGMKFIKTLDGSYINVERVKMFRVDVAYDSHEGEAKFYVLADHEDDEFDISKHDTEEAAQAALDELMTKINGDEG